MSSKKGKRRRGTAGAASATEGVPATRAAPATRPVARATTRPARPARRARREQDAVRRRWLIAGALAGIGLAAVALAFIALPGLLPGAADGSPTPTGPRRALAPPDATPLANPPAEPAGDGTRATIETELGTIVMELYTRSSPVAAHNFVNLAEAGFYDGVGFHRIIPNFMIQGGDPEGTGGGGPGYTIPDEPIVGNYVRGTVAMARTPAPNSQGSQFFIVVADSPHLSGGGYVIFGRVVSGMEVVDRIVAGQRTGPQQDLAVDPVVMQRVAIQRP